MAVLIWYCRDEKKNFAEKAIESVKRRPVMDKYGFYTGQIFDAYEWLGAH